MVAKIIDTMGILKPIILRHNIQYGIMKFSVPGCNISIEGMVVCP
jgi:hypothetical protein